MERRDKRRWTAQQLAQRVEAKTDIALTAHEITMFENGQRAPSPEQMRAMAVALGLSEDWFEGCETEDDTPVAVV
jgi:transcriptional regulator with XRE-family HTH domain